MEISDIISIPNVPADTTTGELMMALFSVIIDSERCDNDIVWDFGRVTSLHPFMISALAVYRDSSSNKISLSNVNGALKAKLDEIMFDAPFESADREGSGTDVSCLYDRNVPPICRFSRICPDIDAIQSGLFSIMTRNIRNRTREWNASGAISYLLSELVCNIQEHSHASCGYMYIQCDDNEDCISICVADNGVTIHGSYIAAQKTAYSLLVGDDHAEALRYSVKGLSTKNRPDNESRGYGLSTNLNMVVNGLGGCFMMLSGKGFFRCDEDGEQFVNLPDGLAWDGTMILVSIPLKQRAGFNVYNYIE